MKRNRLLASAGAALAVMLAATSAQAQTAGISATGNRTLSNLQSSPSGIVRSDITSLPVASIAAGPLDGGTVKIAAALVEAKARSNDAAQSIRAEIGGEGYGPTQLSASRNGVIANGATAIANRQTSGAATASSIATSELGIQAGTTTSSGLALSGNALETSATGNEAVADIGLGGSRSDSGAGIANYQGIAAGGTVSVQANAHSLLFTGAVTSSTFDASGNSERATADGNSSESGITADLTTIEAPASIGIASSVAVSGSSDPAVSASFGILSSQFAGSTVNARAGNLDGTPTFQVTVNGSAGDTQITSDGNSLAATTSGNRSATGISLEAAGIGGAPAAPGAAATVANVTNIQRSDVGTFTASTNGGTGADVLGDLIDSSMSASGNRVEATATANLATTNGLAVNAASIDAGGSDPASLRAAALVDPTGGAGMVSEFGVQNVQDFGRSVIGASQALGTTAISVQGATSHSTLGLDGNAALAAATGNNAVNLAQLDAASVRTSAALNSLQTGIGAVDVAIGSPSLRGGASILVPGGSSDARHFVTRNDATGTAVGSTASNRLVVSASTITGAGANSIATAGPVDGSYGAAADFALASNQKLGEPTGSSGAAAHVISGVYGSFGVSSPASVGNTAVEVSGNTQRADALGNAGVNRLEVSAATLEDGATAALSAFQYAQGTIRATSDAALAAPHTIDHSDVVLQGNRSVALAAANDTDNQLSASGQRTGVTGASLARLDAEPLGPPSASGGTVLANQQFAAGSVSASAILSVGTASAGGSLTASRFSISGNAATAEASANRAHNAVASDSASGAGLVSTQVNTATADAAARGDWSFGSTNPTGAGLSTSALTLSGNTISSLARGNAADNGIGAAKGTADASPGSQAALDRFDASAQAPTAILNNQGNYGAVTARATDSSVPLNGPGSSARSSTSVAGNSMAASAYGNMASNTVSLSGPGQAPGALVANVQANSGNVAAIASGAGLAGAPVSMTGGMFSISGNQAAATAVGNQVSSTITIPTPR